MRIRSIDWLRGLVIVLMTVDHAGSIFDAAHMHGDNFADWTPGSPLPVGEFVTRWITHLCAPTFLLLAGVSLALSEEKRGSTQGVTRFMVTRGLFIAALDPLWMGLGFAGWRVFPLAVLYAIGMSMVCMAFLRKLSSPLLLAIAVAIQIGGELSREVDGGIVWQLLFTGGALPFRLYVIYPLIPWLSLMMFGFVLGRALSERERAKAVGPTHLMVLSVALLAAFVVLRGVDGYGNWGLHREGLDVLQWLHVNKYPPSLTFTLLELGISFGFFSLLMRAEAADPRALRPFSLFGGTAFFFYVLHVHLLALAEWLLGLDRDHAGLAKTWIAAALTLALLAYPCILYRRYKRAHPDGWTRYL
jgi:uncharacterized membrane protein